MSVSLNKKKHQAGWDKTISLSITAKFKLIGLKPLVAELLPGVLFNH